MHNLDPTNLLYLEDSSIPRHKLQHGSHGHVDLRRALYRHSHQLPPRHPEILPTHRPKAL